MKMKYFKKLILLISIITIFLVGFSFNIHAEDTVVEPPTVSDYSMFIVKIENYAKAGCTNRVVYASNSVRANGVLIEPYTDTVKLETGFVIRTSLDLGTRIYDDPATEVIDGIRINGVSATSYIHPIDLDHPQNYVVEIRLDYTDDIFGTYAKIADGNLDLKTVLNEPSLYLKSAYYVIAAVSIIVGGVGAAISKKKRVKTADDIAFAVDARVKEGCENFAILYSDVLKENLLPVFQSMVDTNKSVVKALTLSTSKSKEAAVAMLDTLKEVSDVNVDKAIDEAREQVLKNIANTELKRATIRNTLSHIANGTYQEVHNAEIEIKNATVQAEASSKPEDTSEIKSIF